MRAWRLQRALELGLKLVEAERFAESDGDLHQLEGLIKNAGCAPATAARIVT